MAQPGHFDVDSPTLTGAKAAIHTPSQGKWGERKPRDEGIALPNVSR
jgi:hypothetical protein